MSIPKYINIRQIYEAKRKACHHKRVEEERQERKGEKEREKIYRKKGQDAYLLNLHTEMSYILRKI